MIKFRLTLTLLTLTIMTTNAQIADRRIELTTKVLVKNIQPNQIFNYMLNLTKEKYIEWHKQDHKNYRIIKQTKDTIGSVFHFDEKIAGKYRVNYNWKLIKFVENESLVMKAKFIVPLYLVLKFEKDNQNTIVTQQLRIGFAKNKFINSIIQSIAFSKRKQIALQNHAKEEFENLEKLIK